MVACAKTQRLLIPALQVLYSRFVAVLEPGVGLHLVVQSTAIAGQ